MNIVFWSPVAGRCCTSSTTAALATYISLTENYRCCILPLNCANKGVQRGFVSKENEISLGKTIGNFGIDALIASLIGGFKNAEDIKDTALQLHSKLDFFISSSSLQVKTVEGNIVKLYDSITAALSQSYDLSFIDVGSGYSRTAEKAFNSADILIVCLSQDGEMLNDMFDSCNFGSIPNCLFAVTDYDSNVLFGIHNMQKQFKYMKQGNTFCIQRSAGFVNSLNTSRMLEWFSVNTPAVKKRLLGKKGEDGTEAFFSSLDKASKCILKVIGGAGQ